MCVATRITAIIGRWLKHLVSYIFFPYGKLYNVCYMYTSPGVGLFVVKLDVGMLNNTPLYIVALFSLLVIVSIALFQWDFNTELHSLHAPQFPLCCIVCVLHHKSRFVYTTENPNSIIHVLIKMFFQLCFGQVLCTCAILKTT